MLTILRTFLVAIIFPCVLSLLRAEEIPIFFAPLITESIFPPFTEELQSQSWGQSTLENIVRLKLPHLTLYHRSDVRYMALIKVQELSYWDVQAQRKDEKLAVSLVRVRLRLLLFAEPA